MRWPDGNAGVVGGIAFLLAIFILVLLAPIPSGSAGQVSPLNGMISPSPTGVMINPTDWTYLPYITQIRTPTPTPCTPYITVSPTCIETPGVVVFRVRGENWQTEPSRDIRITWDGGIVLEFPSRARWEAEFVRDIGQTQVGVHTVEAYMVDEPSVHDSEYICVPCLGLD